MRFKYELSTKVELLITGILIYTIFILFSYTVAKEMWQSVDFDTTVKIQDRIPRKFDELFSVFTLLGSAEVTSVVVGAFILFSLFKLRFLSILGLLLFFLATLVEIFGKLVLFHPGPPHFLLRSINVAPQFPTFHIHTNFSYPSGHMLRTTFIATILFMFILMKVKNIVVKLIFLGGLAGFIFMMGLTRVALGEHWLSDVIGGMLLGCSSGLLAFFLMILLPFRKKTEPIIAE